MCGPCARAGVCNGSGPVPLSAVHIPKQRRPVQVGTADPRAVAAAIESSERPYIYLVCGKITTREEQEFFAVWAPKGRGRRRKFWCSDHGRWEHEKTSPKPTTELDAEPMF